jgi:hypothetical protein
MNASNDNAVCEHCTICGSDTMPTIERYGGMSFSSRHCCNCVECGAVCAYVRADEDMDTSFLASEEWAALKRRHHEQAERRYPRAT